MIKTMLIIWSLNSHGVGEVIEQPLPSLAACYATVGRDPPPAGAHAVCIPVGVDTRYADAVAAMNANRCDASNVVGAWIYHQCRGQK